MPLNPCQLHFLQTQKDNIYSLIYVDNQPYDKVLEIICHHGRNWLKEKDFRNAIKKWQKDDPQKWKEIGPNTNRRPNICTSRHEDCSGRGCLEYSRFHGGELPNPMYTYQQQRLLIDQPVPNLPQVHEQRGLTVNPDSGTGVYPPHQARSEFIDFSGFQQDLIIPGRSMNVGNVPFVSVRSQQSMASGLWTPTTSPSAVAPYNTLTQGTTSPLSRSALQGDNIVSVNTMGTQQSYSILDYNNDAKTSNPGELQLTSPTQSHTHTYSGNAKLGFEDNGEEDDEFDSEDGSEDDADMLGTGA